MSAKTRKSSQVPATQVVQIALLPEIVKELTSMKVSTGDLLDQFSEVVKNGHAFNLSYDPDDQKFTARLAGLDRTCPNAGKLLYANGDSILTALLALYGKHFLLSTDGIWESTQQISSIMS